MIFEATNLYYLPNLTNIFLKSLMTEGFKIFYFITILRTDTKSHNVTKLNEYIQQIKKNTLKNSH